MDDKHKHSDLFMDLAWNLDQSAAEPTVRKHGIEKEENLDSERNDNL